MLLMVVSVSDYYINLKISFLILLDKWQILTFLYALPPDREERQIVLRNPDNLLR